MKNLFKISKNETGIKILSYRGNESDLVIPEFIDGLAVTSIGDFAFSRNQLTTISIPNSVTSIGDSAFYSNQLTTISIPNSVTSIGDSAFYSNQLTTISIPNSVTSIGDSAFSRNQLTTISIPNSVTSIGDYAFYSNQLTTISIPNSVTSIGDYAFSRNQLTTISIPNSVTSIGDSAFYSNQLTTISIPNSVTSIGDSAFSRNQLTTISIPNSVTSIGDYAFYSNQLTTISYKKKYNVEMIDDYCMIVDSKKTKGEFVIMNCRFFGGEFKSIYVAKKGEYSSHGKTIKSAIEDVNFKFLQETLNLDELVAKIKKENVMTMVDYRLLTGACQAGCDHFMETNGKKDVTELSLKDAIELTKNAYGSNRIAELFNL